MRDTYRVKVGRFECIIAMDGTNEYQDPLQVLFSEAPRDTLDRELRRYGIEPDRWNVWVSPYTAVVVFTGEAIALIDVGAGSYAPTTGRLVAVLKTEGIDPEDITVAVLTHLHPDHVGGALRAGTLTFPHAATYVARPEWEFWSRDPDLAEMRAPQRMKEGIMTVARQTISALRGRIHMLDGESEIVSGLRCFPSPGHTPGHMAVEVHSDGESLLITSDAFLHPIHIEHPEWSSPLDLDPALAAESRRRILRRSALANTRLVAPHFDFPGVGVVEGAEGSWLWQPACATD